MISLKKLIELLQRKVVIAFSAGAYPLLHYYSNNFDIADTWYQLFLMIIMCIFLPYILIQFGFLVTKISFFKPLKKIVETFVNLLSFFGLLGLLIFYLNKKELVLVFLLCFICSFFLYKYLKKILVLQLLLGVMSLFSLLPKLFFMYHYDDSWAKIEKEEKEIKFKYKPNIYLIQPDGYTNFSKIYESPYDYPEKSFENYLKNENFVFHPKFRSNYYSTLTSNASLFSMKHHYYKNTYKGNLKTYRSQDVIVGTNNVLDILKFNNYKTNFLTDNSFFLTNRKIKDYDYCNVSHSEILFYDTGSVKGKNIVKDFEELMQKKNNTKEANFYFIEKTVPSHINYIKKNSLGIIGEKERYIERVKMANSWILELLEIIKKNDSNPLIIIAGDHGGYVGLNYVKEVERKKLNEEETFSVFSSLLTIKWPKYLDIDHNQEINSSVNLFRQVFYELSDKNVVFSNMESNTSYLPLYDNYFRSNFYQCIDNENKYYYKLVE